MSNDELTEYQAQLDDVESQLRDQPDDQTLLELKDELTTLINMLKEELDTKPANANSNSAPPKYKVGDRVQARRKRGPIEQGKITAITGSSANPSYTVKFDQSTVETLPSESVLKLITNDIPVRSKPKPASPSGPALAPSRHKADSQNKVSKDRPKEQQSHAQILQTSQNKWKDFKSKGMKYGTSLKKKKIGETSIFKSKKTT